MFYFRNVSSKAEEKRYIPVVLFCCYIWINSLIFTNRRLNSMMEGTSYLKRLHTIFQRTFINSTSWNITDQANMSANPKSKQYKKSTIQQDKIINAVSNLPKNLRDWLTSRKQSKEITSSDSTNIGKSICITKPKNDHEMKLANIMKDTEKRGSLKRANVIMRGNINSPTSKYRRNSMQKAISQLPFNIQNWLTTKDDKSTLVTSSSNQDQVIHDTHQGESSMKLSLKRQTNEAVVKPDLKPGLKPDLKPDSSPKIEEEEVDSAIKMLPQNVRNWIATKTEDEYDCDRTSNISEVSGWSVDRIAVKSPTKEHLTRPTRTNQQTPRRPNWESNERKDENKVGQIKRGNIIDYEEFRTAMQNAQKHNMINLVSHDHQQRHPSSNRKMDEGYMRIPVYNHDIGLVPQKSSGVKLETVNILGRPMTVTKDFNQRVNMPPLRDLTKKASRKSQNERPFYRHPSKSKHFRPWKEHSDSCKSISNVNVSLYDESNGTKFRHRYLRRDPNIGENPMMQKFPNEFRKPTERKQQHKDYPQLHDTKITDHRRYNEGNRPLIHSQEPSKMNMKPNLGPYEKSDFPFRRTQRNYYFFPKPQVSSNYQSHNTYDLIKCNQGQLFNSKRFTREPQMAIGELRRKAFRTDSKRRNHSKHGKENSSLKAPKHTFSAKTNAKKSDLPFRRTQRNYYYFPEPPVSNNYQSHNTYDLIKRNQDRPSNSKCFSHESQMTIDELRQNTFCTDSKGRFHSNHGKEKSSSEIAPKLTFSAKANTKRRNYRDLHPLNPQRLIVKEYNRIFAPSHEQFARHPFRKNKKADDDSTNADFSDTSIFESLPVDQSDILIHSRSCTQNEVMKQKSHPKVPGNASPAPSLNSKIDRQNDGRTHKRNKMLQSGWNSQYSENGSTNPTELVPEPKNEMQRRSNKPPSPLIVKEYNRIFAPSYSLFMRNSLGTSDTDINQDSKDDAEFRNPMGLRSFLDQPLLSDKQKHLPHDNAVKEVSPARGLRGQQPTRQFTNPILSQSEAGYTARSFSQPNTIENASSPTSANWKAPATNDTEKQAKVRKPSPLIVKEYNRIFTPSYAPFMKNSFGTSDTDVHNQEMKDDAEFSNPMGLRSFLDKPLNFDKKSTALKKEPERKFGKGNISNKSGNIPTSIKKESKNVHLKAKETTSSIIEHRRGRQKYPMPNDQESNNDTVKQLNAIGSSGTDEKQEFKKDAKLSDPNGLPFSTKQSEAPFQSKLSEKQEATKCRAEGSSHTHLLSGALPKSNIESERRNDILHERSKYIDSEPQRVKSKRLSKHSIRRNRPTEDKSKGIIQEEIQQVPIEGTNRTSSSTPKSMNSREQDVSSSRDEFQRKGAACTATDLKDDVGNQEAAGNVLNRISNLICFMEKGRNRQSRTENENVEVPISLKQENKAARKKRSLAQRKWMDPQPLKQIPEIPEENLTYSIEDNELKNKTILSPNLPMKYRKSSCDKVSTIPKGHDNLTYTMNETSQMQRKAQLDKDKSIGSDMQDLNYDSSSGRTKVGVKTILGLRAVNRTYSISQTSCTITTLDGGGNNNFSSDINNLTRSTKINLTDVIYICILFFTLNERQKDIDSKFMSNLPMKIDSECGYFFNRKCQNQDERFVLQHCFTRNNDRRKTKLFTVCNKTATNLLSSSKQVCKSQIKVAPLSEPERPDDFRTTNFNNVSEHYTSSTTFPGSSLRYNYLEHTNSKVVQEKSRSLLVPFLATRLSYDKELTPMLNEIVTYRKMVHHSMTRSDSSDVSDNQNEQMKSEKDISRCKSTETIDSFMDRWNNFKSREYSGLSCNRCLWCSNKIESIKLNWKLCKMRGLRNNFKNPPYLTGQHQRLERHSDKIPRRVFHSTQSIKDSSEFEVFDTSSIIDFHIPTDDERILSLTTKQSDNEQRLKRVLEKTLRLFTLGRLIKKTRKAQIDLPKSKEEIIPAVQITEYRPFSSDTLKSTSSKINLLRRHSVSLYDFHVGLDGELFVPTVATYLSFDKDIKNPLPEEPNLDSDHLTLKLKGFETV